MSSGLCVWEWCILFACCSSSRKEEKGREWERPAQRWWGRGREVVPAVSSTSGRCLALPSAHGASKLRRRGYKLLQELRTTPAVGGCRGARGGPPAGVSLFQEPRLSPGKTESPGSSWRHQTKTDLKRRKGVWLQEHLIFWG